MKISKKNIITKKIKLKDVSVLNMGQSPSSNSYTDKNSGLPFFQGVTEFGYKYPIEKIYTNEPKKWAYKNSILLSVRAPVGKINIADKDVVIGRGLASIQHLPNINRDYLYFKLISDSHKWKKISKGSIFDSVNKKDIEDFIIVITTDLKQQEKIASTLSLQERQIEIIEKLIEKLETRNQYYAEKLLSGERRIKRNEQGEIEFYDNTEWQEVSLNGKVVFIPCGWEVKKMNDIIHLKKGNSIKSELLNYNGVGIPYLRTNEVWEKSSVNKDKIYYDGELNNIELKTKEDYVVCLDGFNTEPNLGTVGLVTNNGEGICCGELHKIIDIENVSKKYVNIMLLKGCLFQELICRYAEGSTVKHAGKHFKRIENILISFEEQLILNEIFKKQLSEIDLLKKIKEKEKLRFQWMLDNLLSGEYQIID